MVRVREMSVFFKFEERSQVTGSAIACAIRERNKPGGGWTCLKTFASGD